MPLPSELYDRAYFESDYCEGWHAFKEGAALSALKLHQVELLAPRPGLRVLDAGVGRGEVLLACARRGATVAGIDYSGAAIELSRETLAEVADAELVLGSVEQLPWPDGHFDRVLCADVIEHLDPDEAARALVELRRVLAPGGRLLIHTAPNRRFRRVTWPVARRVMRLVGLQDNAERMETWLRQAQHYHVNEQTPRTLRVAMCRAGFVQPKVWLDANLIRGGEHHLTRGLANSWLAGVAARLARFGPARELLSNDIYALVRDLRTARCAVCGGASLRPHLQVTDHEGELHAEPTTSSYGRALGDIARCPACGHMQVAPVPDSSELLEAYGSAWSEESVREDAGPHATSVRTLSAIEALRPGKGRLLDVGCWAGGLLAEARSRGWDVAGIEPSERASRHAREVHGLDVQRAYLLEAELVAGSFDAVVMEDVLEHLVDPGEGLDRIAELLRPGGILHLALPDAGSRLARVLGRRWWSVLPTHVQYFTRGSLLTLLHEHGYEPLRVETGPKTFSLGYYLGRLEGYAGLLSRALVRAAGAVGVADRLWTPDFRDRTVVLARRGPVARPVVTART